MDAAPASVTASTESASAHKPQVTVSGPVPQAELADAPPGLRRVQPGSRGIETLLARADLKTRSQLLIRLQRTAGNGYVQGLVDRTNRQSVDHAQDQALTPLTQRATSMTALRVQRAADPQIIAALQKPDPVAGVGDFPEAFRIINGLPMGDMLATLMRLKGPGHFAVLNGNLQQAVGVNVPRLRLAFTAVSSKGATAAEQFEIDQRAALDALPEDQKKEVMTFLSPSWVPAVPLELLPTLSDPELGTQYQVGQKGDPARVEAVENEIDRRMAAAIAILPGGVAAAGGQTTPGTTKISPDVAEKILENMAKGEPGFKPELGKGGSSWFVVEGNPHVGVDAAKNIEVAVEVANLDKAVTFHEADLIKIYEEEALARAEEVKVEFRRRFNLPENANIAEQNSRLRKAFKQLEKNFVETKMWDRVGERVAASPSKVGKVILKGSRFSKSGDGAFAVVADAKKIKIKGGVPKLIEAMEAGGAKADPVVAQAAEQLVKKMAWAGKIRGVLRVGGRIVIVLAVAYDVYEIYQAEDHVKKVFEKLGGWAGAAAAAAMFSAVWTPADVAGPGAWVVHGVGVLIAGGVGYYVGSTVTTWVYELVAV